MGRTAAGGGTGKPESRGLFRKSAAPERGWGSFGCLQYWFGEREEKDKSCNIRYAAAHFPDAELSRMKGLGHAEMAAALTQFAERHGT